MGSVRFSQFPLLPTELRIKVWQFALPDSRIIDLKFHSMYKPERNPCTFDHDMRGTRRLTAARAPEQIPLLQISREAREVALGSYELIPFRSQDALIYEDNDKCLGFIYADLSRDLFHIERCPYSPWKLRHSVITNKAHSASCLSMWRSRIRHLLVNLKDFCGGPWMLETAEFPDYDPSSDFRQGGRSVPLGAIAEVLNTFDDLEVLSFVIDGRQEFVESKIVEATDKFDDYYHQHGQTQALTWIPWVIAKLKSGFPTLLIPQVELALLIDEGGSINSIERRWDYRRARCRIFPPGYDEGSRSEASSHYGDTDFSSDSPQEDTDSEASPRQNTPFIDYDYD